MADVDRQKYVPQGMNMTLQEIADILGTSRERVRQIEARALSKLRRILIAKGYNPEDFFGDIIDTPSKSAHIRPD
jgi:DNA-directed RNA polymerase sigma subunit (sigma70/sigma32)